MRFLLLLILILSLSTISYGGELDNLSVKQLSGMGKLITEFPGLKYKVNNKTGTIRSLSNGTGYLSKASTESPGKIGSSFTPSILDALDINPEDITLESELVHPISGAGNAHYVQSYKGIPVYKGILQYNVNKDGRIYAVYNDTIPGLDDIVDTVVPTIDKNSVRKMVLNDSDISKERATITEPKLVLYPEEKGIVHLSWLVNISSFLDAKAYTYMINAASGDILIKHSAMHNAPQIKTYSLEYPTPIPGPLWSTPAWPSDGRTTVVYTPDPTASPHGWHSDGLNLYTTLQGNNVHVYVTGPDYSGYIPDQPDCGPDLDCTFPIDFAKSYADPVNTGAVAANIFYIANFVHDMQYLYGFTETTGNFQVNNFGRGGVEGDPIRILANNQPMGDDGCGPLATANLPYVDGGYGEAAFCSTAPAPPGASKVSSMGADLGIHELYHSYTARTVGGIGPSSDGCYGWPEPYEQSTIEHVSWAPMMYKLNTADTFDTTVPYSQWSGNQDLTGPGIYRYCNFNADLSAVIDLINVGGCGGPSSDPVGWTFETLGDSGMTGAKGYKKGQLLSINLWQVMWKLIGEHGIGDLKDGPSGGIIGGNQRMFLYYHEAFMNMPCNPGYLDIRDAVVAAATNNYGGEDVCLVWEGFAQRGMGYDAVSSSNDTLVVTNGFGVPPACE